jgi:very-short-patch-repair endonuclease
VGWPDVFAQAGVRVASRELLMAYGMAGRMLTTAVKSGALVRARRDHYVLPVEPRSVVEATRVGGRLACISALEAFGLFAVHSEFPHIHICRGMSRMRSPRSRFVPLTDHTRDGIELHWWPLAEPDHATEHSVSVIDALAQTIRCQHPWLAVASIDSAIFNGAISADAVARLFSLVPEQYRPLATKIDGRAEAGQETVLRMILEEADLHFELQVVIPGVGRVDFVVEGCLVVEADSRLAHDGWERHVEDRRRDLQLAAIGYMSLRPAYQHTMHEPVLVTKAIVGLLAQSKNFRRAPR